ncbi:MAG: hypothetical protein H7282_05345 [Cytophagaceae bacterium]|nr:hypothetical protein [Cytophagaceae bacterium]
MGDKKTIEKQPLIKGCFHPDEAREIISSLFYNKMQFHSISSLSIRERTGGDTSFHEQRIIELTKSLNEIFSVINLAKTNEDYLNISSDIHVSLTEKPN